MKLQGKSAIVTGAGRGIGRGIALQLAREGCAVAVNYAHSERGALELVENIRRMGQPAVALKADVSVKAEIEDMVSRAAETFGKIDILVNNAAVDPVIDFFEVTEDQYDRILGTNLKGAFFCAQACAREMKRLGKGSIINISSVHGNTTLPRYAAYAASKGGMNALTRQLALDLAAWKINVNAVAPGVIEVEKYKDIPNYDRDSTSRKIPWGRVGTSEDVAPIVAFLASDDAEFITGQVITVDGGSSTRFFLWDGEMR